MSAARPPGGDPLIVSAMGTLARIVPSTAAELLLSLLHGADTRLAKRSTEAEQWAMRARKLGPEARILARLGQHPTINLLGLAFDAGEPQTPEALLAGLGSLPPEEIVMTAVGAYRRTIRRQTNAEVIRAAVMGDKVARREFRETGLDMPEWHRSIDFLLGKPAAEMGRDILAAIERWHEVVYAPDADRIAGEQDASAAALGELRRTWSVDALMAHVLPGVDYVPPDFVTEVAFVPDVVLRPGLVFLDHRMMSIASFPVARPQEAADAPPEVLVRLGKALGDELRLRALRSLARGPISLGDLAGELGVPRSTLAHHVGVLRNAGLVAMTIDDGRWGRLRLRADGIDDAPAVFRRYVLPENR
jgi:DNA-binding transcriptional ArsR family regulator